MVVSRVGVEVGGEKKGAGNWADLEHLVVSRLRGEEFVEFEYDDEMHCMYATSV